MIRCEMNENLKDKREYIECSSLKACVYFEISGKIYESNTKNLVQLKIKDRNNYNRWDKYIISLKAAYLIEDFLSRIQDKSNGFYCFNSSIRLYSDIKDPAVLDDSHNLKIFEIYIMKNVVTDEPFNTDINF